MDREISRSMKKVAREAPGNAIEIRRPKECALAIEMLSNGETYYKIREATGFGTDAISRIKLRHQGVIAKRREKAADEAEELADQYREVLRQKASGLLENEIAMAKLNPKDAALTLGILTDKARDLRGEATAVIEHRKGYSLEDAAEMIRAAQKKVRGEAIDV